MQLMKPCFICQFPLDHLSLFCFQAVVEYASPAPFHLYSKGIKQEAVLQSSYLGKLWVFHLPAGLEWKSWHWMHHSCNGAQFRRVSAEFCFTQWYFGAPILKNKRHISCTVMLPIASCLLLST